MAAPMESALAFPVPTSESAVPWSTEVRMMGSPGVQLTDCTKINGLQGRETLVMVHRHDHVQASSARL